MATLLPALPFALFVALAAFVVPVAGAAAPSAEPPASVDLRPRLEGWGLAPRRQGERGTCSVFTVTGALEYALAAREQHGTRLSVEFLNWAGHHAVGRTSDGGFFSDLWSGFERYGVCTEQRLPYRSEFDGSLMPDAATLTDAGDRKKLGLKLHWIKEWDVKTGLTDAQLQTIRKTIAGGWPVCGGFRWPKRPQWNASVLQMCPPNRVFDGHSVLLVGYRDDPQQPGGGVVIIRNSGGDGQDGYLPYDYLRAYMNDAAWIAG